MVNADNGSRDGSGSSGQFGVPRRFGVGTLLTITAIFAALFGMLSALGAHPIEFGGVTLFFVAVALGQAVLFKGKRPREASLLVGGCLLPLVLFVEAVVTFFAHGYAAPVAGMACSLPVLAGVGALLGYLAGGVIAGVLLVTHLVGRRLAGRQLATTAPGDDKHDTTPLPRKAYWQAGFSLLSVFISTLIVEGCLLVLWLHWMPLTLASPRSFSYWWGIGSGILLAVLLGLCAASITLKTHRKRLELPRDLVAEQLGRELPQRTDDQVGG